MINSRGTLNILAVMFILVATFAFSRLVRDGNNLVLFLSLLLIFIFLFNIIVRGMIAFKPYFLSKWNILSSKFRKEFEFDIPRELVFEKLLEVIEAGPFILKYANKADYEILAISKFSWKSWGENIYISLIESEENTIIRFESAALFQMYVWGKHEKNFDDFLHHLDESLTV